MWSLQRRRPDSLVPRHSAGLPDAQRRPVPDDNRHIPVHPVSTGRRRDLDMRIDGDLGPVDSAGKDTRAAGLVPG